MPEHETIYYVATMETLESVLALCHRLLKEAEQQMEKETPFGISSDCSRDYIKGRAFNEGAVYMARRICAAVGEEIKEERQYHKESLDGYEEYE